MFCPWVVSQQCRGHYLQEGGINLHTSGNSKTDFYITALIVSVMHNNTPGTRGDYGVYSVYLHYSLRKFGFQLFFLDSADLPLIPLCIDSRPVNNIYSSTTG